MHSLLNHKMKVLLITMGVLLVLSCFVQNLVWAQTPVTGPTRAKCETEQKAKQQACDNQYNPLLHNAQQIIATEHAAAAASKTGENRRDHEQKRNAAQAKYDELKKQKAACYSAAKAAFDKCLEDVKRYNDLWKKDQLDRLKRERQQKLSELDNKYNQQTAGLRKQQESINNQIRTLTQQHADQRAKINAEYNALEAKVK